MIDVMERASAMMTNKTFTPLWTTPEGMRKWHEEQNKQDSVRITQMNKEQKLKNKLGCSGIKKKHANCSFENYTTPTQEQRWVFREAQELLNNYRKHMSTGFVFSGTPGTGKNHLACAIANALLHGYRTVVVITVAELMSKFREVYSDRTVSENEVVKFYAGVDLLVLDEVGRSHTTENQRVLLDRIIDLRYQNEKPTGLITNLQQADLVNSIGEAALERVLENDGKWLTFNWASYRR